jgi:hypothetical protein
VPGNGLLGFIKVWNFKNGNMENLILPQLANQLIISIATKFESWVDKTATSMNMMSYMRTALIIQGPIISIGRTGQSLNNPDETLNSTFNCVENINFYIENYSSYFDYIILSSWKDQDTSKILRKENVHIVLSPEMRKGSRNIDRRLGIYRDNKLRQFYSFREGLLLARHLGCELSIKVRTDNRVDVENIYKCALMDSNKLWVPKYDSIPNFLGDFYYAGKTNLMIEFCNVLLDKKNLYRSVHWDTFYSYSYYRMKTQFSIFDCFPRSDKFSPSQIEFILYAWKAIFNSLPIEIWNTQEWRGKGVFKRYDDSINETLKNLSAANTSMIGQRKRIIKTVNWRNFIYFLMGETLFYLVIDLIPARLIFWKNKSKHVLPWTRL